MKISISKLATLLAIAFMFFLFAISHLQAAPMLRANGKIAFTSDRDGNSEIYLMNSDGTGQMRLTNSPDREDYATWSPDGRRIAFLRLNKGIFSINLMNADGTNPSELTRFVPNNISSYPNERFGISWSPDGGKIAFQDSTDIFTINLDGSNRINLTNGQFINYEPSWSPDGSRIAFARSIFSHGFYPDVYVMNVDGSNVTRITDAPDYGESRFPDWSPDGQRITLGLSADILDPPSLALIDPDGTNIQFLQFPWYRNKPKWSPDGTKIVLYRNGNDNISQIWTVNRDGGGSTQLTTASPNNFNPDWQPLVINVTNVEELYSAVNNPQNAGSQIVIAPGVYLLTVNDASNIPRPNGGRLELQENMSLLGVIGDRNAVVIEAINLPASSYNGEIPNSGVIRMGKGTNSVEWLTITDALEGGGGIIAHLSAPGTTHIRVAHVASLGSRRGIEIRNAGAASAAYVIEADIVDNDLANNEAEGIRLVNPQDTSGGVIIARLSNNRSRGNRNGMLMLNSNSSFGTISVTSLNDRFYENAAGTIILCGLSTGSTADGNTCNFTAKETSFENNNGSSGFDLGGLVIIGGENIAFPDGTSNNTVNVSLSACPMRNNQLVDLAAIGARSNPEGIGSPGTNNHVTLDISNAGANRMKQVFINSMPDLPGLMNTVMVTNH